MLRLMKSTQSPTLPLLLRISSITTDGRVIGGDDGQDPSIKGFPFIANINYPLLYVVTKSR